MDWRQILQQLGNKASQNIHEMGDVQKKAAELEVKKIKDPNYQPTPEDMLAKKQYEDSVVAAVSGSVAPVPAARALAPALEEAGGVLGKSQAAQKLSNSIYDMAMGGNKAVTQDVASMAQQGQARGVDAAERYAEQLKRAKMAALNKFRGR